MQKNKFIMGVPKPFKRTAREFTDNAKKRGGLWYYILDDNFADSPEHYIRAFLILQKDFLNLLDYIEPADKNLETYSFRIHELLLRTCIEIEANFVAILKENGYSKSSNWTIEDYRKVNNTHHLSSYRVKLPVWNGIQNLRNPFEKFSEDKSPEWWTTYNKTKHNRHKKFENATFKQLTDAICGLVVILTAQFTFIEFSHIDHMLYDGGDKDGMENAIGSYFRIKYPSDWLEEEKYDFDWDEIKGKSNPIEIYNYK